MQPPRDRRLVEADCLGEMRLLDAVFPDRGVDRQLHRARRVFGFLRQLGERLRHVLGGGPPAALAHLGAQLLQAGAGGAQAAVATVVVEICHWVRILVTESKKDLVVA